MKCIGWANSYDAIVLSLSFLFFYLFFKYIGKLHTYPVGLLFLDEYLVGLEPTISPSALLQKGRSTI
jgi:hypothetical protein